MGKEIVIGKTPYSVEVLDEATTGGAYLLTSLKGPAKQLCLMRNVPRPELMFAVRFPNCKPTNMWFTDKGGTLQTCKTVTVR